MTYDIENMLDEVSGALAYNIDRRMYHTSPWVKVIPKRPWEDEIGKSFETLKIERAEVVTDNGWRTLGVPDGTGPEPCVPPLTQVKFNTSRQAVTLLSRAVESLPICVEDMRSKWMRAEQLAKAETSLEEVIRNIWIDHFRDNYFANCDRKIVAASGLPTTDSTAGYTFDTTAATSPLTNAMLKNAFLYLMREGAGQDCYSTDGGEDIYVLICSHEQSQFLRTQDDTIKQDYRDSSRADENLRGVGFVPTHSYNGFVHMVDPHPNRYTHDGSDYTKVPSFIKDVTSGKVIQNPAYEAAEFEDTAIFVKTVYEALVPPSITSIARSTYDPQNYVGDIKWSNIKDRERNPDGTIGLYRAVLETGIRPRRTEFGVAFRHLRCIDDGVTTCEALQTLPAGT